MHVMVAGAIDFSLPDKQRCTVVVRYFVVNVVNSIVKLLESGW